MTTADTQDVVTPTDSRNGEAGRLCVQRLVGRHSTATLYKGDCLAALEEVRDVDAVITDPPYGTTACEWDAVIPLGEMWRLLDAATKPSSAVVIFGAQPFTSALVMSRPERFKYSWTWDKGQISNPQLAKIQPLKICEDICVFGNGRTKYNPQNLSDDIERVVKRRGDWAKTLGAKRNLGHIQIAQEYSQQMTGYPKSIIYFPKGRTNLVHPTEKPVELMEYLVRTYTDAGDTVLDFTMGSGTTGVACLRNNRNFIGIERDAEYYKLACDRIAHELDGALL